LTRATLDNTVGDPLFPGIELHWCAKERATYLFDYDVQFMSGGGGDDTVIHGGIEDRPHRLPNHDPPFRVDHSKVTPGHLTRGLSLPWQSDFSQCNTHWWPSARPDDVITIRDWRRGARHEDTITEEVFTRSVAPRRKKWARGMRETPDFPSEYFPGCTDMVRSWQSLGFVTKQEKLSVKDKSSGQDLPVWLEGERLQILGTLDQHTYEWAGIAE